MRLQTFICIVAVTATGALAVPALAGATVRSFVSTRCSVAPGANSRLDSPTEAVSFNFPYLAGPTSGFANAAAHSTAGLARAEASPTVNDDCTTDGLFNDTLTVGAGTSGLADGAPVTLRLNLGLSGVVAGGGLITDAPFLATVDMFASYKLRGTEYVCGGEGCELPEFADFSFSLHRGIDAFAGSVVDPNGSLTHDLRWAWDLTGNGAAAQGDSADVSAELCSAWPCAIATSDPRLQPFAVPVGVRSIEFQTKVGARIAIDGRLNILSQAGRGASYAKGNLLGGLHAEIAPADGYGGLSLSYESAPTPPPPPLPSLAVRDVTIQEGDVTTPNASFVVSLSAPAATSITVEYATADGTATAPGDYGLTNGTLTFAPGETAKAVTVPIVDDSSSEGAETFALDLMNPIGATIQDGHAVATIEDDDSALPELSIADLTVTEGTSGTSDAKFTVSLSKPSTKIVTFRYVASDGTAKAGQDYEATELNVSFDLGQTSVEVTVPIINDMALESPTETFFVDISPISGATIARGHAIGTIVNNGGSGQLRLVGSDLVFTANAGFDNHISVDADHVPGHAPELLFSESGVPFEIGAGCTRPGDGWIHCQPAPVNVNLGDGDDFMLVPRNVDTVLAVISNIGPFQIYGGDGDDEIGSGTGNTDVLDGGPGDDLIRVGHPKPSSILALTTTDVISGGTGNDTFSDGCYDDNTMQGSVLALDPSVKSGCSWEKYFLADFENLSGGNGNDTLVGNAGTNRLDGGAGHDTVSYNRSAPVSVWLDGIANDGELGENDNIVNVEDLVGGGEDDTFVGDALANTLLGGGGKDTIEGGAGVDRLEGGPGDDVVRALDGAADAVVSCGGDTDKVAADAADPVDATCESVGTTGNVSPGGTLSSPQASVQVSVTSPVGGPVVIEEGSSTATPTAWSFLGAQVSITTPPGTAAAPLSLQFRIDASLIPAGVTAATLQVFRNGVVVPACTGPAGAYPDPCVSARATLADGDIQITVLTSKASTWTFGTPVLTRGAVGGLLQTSNGTAATFLAASDGTKLEGALAFGSYRSVKATALAVSGRKAWLAGFGTDGRPYLAYVEDNGANGQGDVFRLWIAGVEQTTDGRLSRGDVTVR
jgi:Ca2+-binding RTX toxin-like protein